MDQYESEPSATAPQGHDDAIDLRTQIAAAPKNAGGARQYPKGLRRLATGYVRRRVAAGRSMQEISSELDVSSNTLWGWTMRARKNRKKKVRPVRIVGGNQKAKQAHARDASLKKAGVVVVLPSGVRIEGLKASEVATVVKALA